MQVATPPLTVTAVAQPDGSGLPFSLNATVPAGVPGFPLGSDTVAVKVTLWPYTAVAGATKVVVVATALTCRLAVPELAAKLLEPA